MIVSATIALVGLAIIVAANLPSVLKERHRRSQGTYRAPSWTPRKDTARQHKDTARIARQ